jgi:hypothetical protein
VPKLAFAEAAGHARVALALDPGAATATAALAAVSAYARGLDEAHALAQRAKALNPSNALANFALAAICVCCGCAFHRSRTPVSR